MPFKLLWGLLESKEGKVPSSEEFSTSKSGYKFYPFSHKGRIFTFDKLIWNKDAQRIYWPNLQIVKKIIMSTDQDLPYCIFAFSDMDSGPAIEDGQPSEMHVIPSDLQNDFSKKFVDLGYDIICAMGISALTDIGYTSEELPLFNNIRLNKYGLSDHVEEAMNLAKIASRLAPEHADFFPVNLWGSNKFF